MSNSHGNQRNKGNDFQSFLYALSGQDPPPPRKPDTSNLQKKQTKPAAPSASPAKPTAHRPKPNTEDEHKDTGGKTLKRKSSMLSKKNLLSNQQKFLPRKSLPSKNRTIKKENKRTVLTGKDDSTFLMGTREKGPQVSLKNDSGFLPRMDKFSHPVAKTPVKPIIKTEEIEKPPVKLEEVKATDTGRLSASEELLEPKTESQPETAPKDKKSEKEDRFALSNVSIKPKINLDQLLETVVRENATDMHVGVGAIPSLRIHGEILQMELPDLDEETTNNLLLPILNEEQRNLLEENGEVDFSYDYFDKARFRINYFKHHWGVGAVFHMIPTQIPTLKQLGLPQVVTSLIKQRKGLILVSGPSGSGKSTTIASLLNTINNTRKLRIITLERPIEYIINSNNCLVSQREVGKDVDSFNVALWNVVREDPDIIMISDLWNKSDVKQVLKIAETGHLVIAAIQTIDTTKAIERIINFFPDKEQNIIKIMLSESLVGIISQRLIPKIDGRGRVGAYEVLISSTGMASIIREGKLSQIPSMIQTGKSQGMQTMDQSLLKLVEQGMVSPQIIRDIISDVRYFKRAGIRFD
ncbi:MAG: PilT/PilU family type 4a pilus ATPase [Vulcanimicrobiota bacterium]